MSLTKYQYPSSSVVGRYIHQDIYPEYYTCLSSIYSYSDFKYKFKLYTLDGLVSTTKNPPYINTYGVYNPNPYLKNILGIDFQPNINSFSTCDNSIKNYRVVCDEMTIQATTGSTAYQKSIVIKSSKEDFNIQNYVMDGNGKFFTNWTSIRKMSLTNEYGTLRFYTGRLENAVSYVYEILIKVTKGNLIYDFISVEKNPYYVETTIVGPSTNNFLLEDKSKYLLEFPCSPTQLNNENWILKGILSPTGYTSYGTNWTSDILEEGNSYEFYTHYNPIGTTSSSMKFIVDTPCSYHKNIQLMWENELGGFDFYTFRKADTENITINKSNFRKVRDEINVFSNNTVNGYIGHYDINRGLETFHNEINVEYVINTDWLTNQEVEDFRDLWVSKNIFAYIDSKWYPVVSLIDSVVVTTSVRGLRQYKFSFVTSNKKYN